MNIAIVTACPSGVATSIVAADLLANAAAKLGLNAKVVCQSPYSDTAPLTSADIEQAELIIIAANTAVDNAAFVGKKVYQASLEAALINATAFLQQAQTDAVELAPTTATNSSQHSQSEVKKIVAITACPTGVAHTFMARGARDRE